MTKTHAATASAPPRPPSSRASRKWIPGMRSRAHALLRKYMDQEKLDVAKLARKLDCTWAKASAILLAESDPSLLQMSTLKTIAGIQYQHWFEAP
jgi:hypothetical protein